jgi:hypothetical protein
MSFRHERLQEAELTRLDRVKKAHHHDADPLGADMVGFFKQAVAKRQTKLARIAECWARLVPETFNDRCALESLHRNTLTVIVDSSSHLYELKQLLLAGLEQQILLACKSTGLRKITLKRGQWYETTPEGAARLRFD